MCVYVCGWDDIVGISCFVYGSNLVVFVPTFVMNSGHKTYLKLGLGCFLPGKLDFEPFHCLDTGLPKLV